MARVLAHTFSHEDALVAFFGAIYDTWGPKGILVISRTPLADWCSDLGRISYPVNPQNMYQRSPVVGTNYLKFEWFVPKTGLRF